MELHEILNAGEFSRFLSYPFSCMNKWMRRMASSNRIKEEEPCFLVSVTVFYKSFIVIKEIGNNYNNTSDAERLDNTSCNVQNSRAICGDFQLGCELEHFDELHLVLVFLANLNRYSCHVLGNVNAYKSIVLIIEWFKAVVTVFTFSPSYTVWKNMIC